ncbi:hypothetical protein B0J11DRAFT_446611 [Dendryphion nanum]|uniref:Uncharacterized protein n=1 Tax=Dendryphion nanum TaxID=256645 RepID=A0A9P9D3J2_9PLEO|nr:hypothetical protein B0J11DRAFT_446611 [Dendryphion nanum]
MAAPRPRLNRWWIPSEGIARVVISADIQRYLGPDAVGIPGYWITAPRTLTTEMIQDLKLDTQRWEQEQREAGRRGSPTVREGKSSRHPDFSLGQQDSAPSYEASVTHRSRHYYGPSTSDSPHQTPAQPERTPRQQTYQTEPQQQTHYVATPSPHYSQGMNQSQTGAPAYYNPQTTAPRTTPANVYPYSQHSQHSQPAPRQEYQYATQPQHHYYQTPTAQNPYSSHGHNPYSPHSHSAHPPPHNPQPQAAPRYFGYFSDGYIAADGSLVYH